MKNKSLRNLIIILEGITLVGVLYVLIFVLDFRFIKEFADQLLFIALGTLAANAFFKIILLRKHKLQIEAKINSKNTDHILDADITSGTDKKEVNLTYPFFHMILLGAQTCFSLMVVLLFFQTFEMNSKFWLRIATTFVLIGSTIATFIYVVYMNEEENI